MTQLFHLYCPLRPELGPLCGASVPFQQNESVFADPCDICTTKSIAAGHRCPLCSEPAKEEA